VTSKTLSGLPTGVTHFAVTARDLLDNESSYSNVISINIKNTSTPPEGITLPIVKSIGHDMALAAVNDANRLLREDPMWKGLDEVLRHELFHVKRHVSGKYMTFPILKQYEEWIATSYSIDSKT